jgi:quercetin dioxygenase-like cupin family protein
LPADKQPILLSAEDGTRVDTLGASFIIKAGRDETRDAYLATIVELEPGHSVPAHVHAGFDEAIYVVDGEPTFRLGESIVRQPVGSFTFIPGGLAHSQANESSSVVRLLVIVSPPENVQQFLAAVGGKSEQEVLRLMREHGMQLVEEPAP